MADHPRRVEGDPQFRWVTKTGRCAHLRRSEKYTMCGKQIEGKGMSSLICESCLGQLR